MRCVANEGIVVEICGSEIWGALYDMENGVSVTVKTGRQMAGNANECVLHFLPRIKYCVITMTGHKIFFD